MKKSRIIAILCCLTMLFSVAACSKEGGSGGQSATGTIDTSNGEVPYEGGTHIYNYTSTGKNIVEGATSDYKIVYPADFEADESTAADEIRYWIEESTGVRLEKVTDEGLTYSSDSKYISVGDTTLAEQAGVTLTEDVGYSGFQIKTEGDSIFLIGETASGVLFGSYELLYRLVNFRTYSSDMSVCDEKTSIELYDFDITDIPDFEYRMTQYGFVRYNETTANRMRMNQEGDVWISVGGNYWHNTFKYLPPDDYLEDHPDWYDSSSSPQQLCFLAHGDDEPGGEAEQLYNTFLTNFISYLDANPDIYNITITQEDVNVWCECPACNAQQEKYGTDAATIVQFCNKISDGVKAHYEALGQTRDINICFFAYHKTETAPVKLVDGEYQPIDDSVICRDNVSVFYAPIFADYSHSFYEQENSNVATTLEGWRALSDKLYLWIYSTNFSYYLYPYNSFNSMQGNYWFALNHGGSYMFDQAQYNNYNSTGWGRLKAYLNSELQWDASQNMNDLIDEFFENYYAEAAEPMRELFNMYRTHFAYIEEYLGVGGAIGGRYYGSEYWPIGTLNAMLDKIDEAYAAIDSLQRTDPARYSTMYDRICIESIAYRFLKINNYSSRFTASDLLAEQESFRDDCERMNLTKFSESSDISTLWTEWGI